MQSHGGRWPRGRRAWALDQAVYLDVIRVTVGLGWRGGCRQSLSSLVSWKIVRRKCGGASEEQRTGKGPGRQGRRRQLLLARESMEQCPRTAKLPLCGVGFS